MRRTIKLLLGTAIFLQSMNALALEDDNDLVKAALNPLKFNEIAKHTSLPFENDTNFGYGSADGEQNILNFKPVIPFVLSADYDLIIRTIAPIFENTAIPNRNDINRNTDINGWGDINPTFFLTPAKFNKVMWGLGPTIFIPTASNNKYIGSGKYSIGPELGVYAMPGRWLLGVLTYNVWSIAGNQNRKAVDQFSFQYLISYIFDKGWFISTNPTVTANWHEKTNQRWLVPFGISGGRTFSFGDNSISASIAGYYNVIRPSTVGPTWQMQVEFEWLFKGIN